MYVNGKIRYFVAKNDKEALNEFKMEGDHAVNWGSSHKGDLADVVIAPD